MVLETLELVKDVNLEEAKEKQKLLLTSKS